jgi:hypothetical protein
MPEVTDRLTCELGSTSTSYGSGITLAGYINGLRDRITRVQGV